MYNRGMGPVFLEKFKKLWEGCGHITQGFSIYSFFVWVGTGGGMSAISWFWDLPIPFIIFVGPATFAIGLIISNQWAWRKTNSTKTEKADKSTDPTLELTGGRTDPPYFESVELSHHWVRVCRIMVRNTSSSKSIYGVRVRLESISPRPPSLAGIPFPLHIMNDNPSPDGEFKESIDLAPGISEYFDVVSHADSEEAYGYLIFGHTVKGINNLVFHDRKTVGFAITISASGEDTPTVRGDFLVGWKDGIPFLENYVDPLSASQITRKPQDPDTPHSSTQVTGRG